LKDTKVKLNRRACLQACLGMLTGFANARGQQHRAIDLASPGDWVCPMDPDVRSDAPGVCPRCGMTLVLHIPDSVEYLLEVSHSPEVLKPGADAVLTFRVLDPETGQHVQRFAVVHEKLMHLFLVSENLQFFAHVHPLPLADGLFRVSIRLPYGGMYRLLADYYPSGSVPQLSVKTLYVLGSSEPPNLAPSLGPSRSENLTASLRLDPEQPLAGLQTKMFFTLEPATGLEPYLGAWAHMLAASEDLIDLMHLHPVFADGGPSVQFNLVFPRAGAYRVWTQFQREGVVNTVVFTVPVKAL
jgi:Heavy metal binding domain